MLAKALASASASAPKVYVEDVFSTWLYDGTGATQTITNGIDLAGKGGMVWIKRRNNISWHFATDTARGTNKQLVPNENNTGESFTNFITAFNGEGFSLGSNINGNNASDTYASWTFRKAAKFFDVVTYTGTGADQTISHNLGSTPGCVIVKTTTLSGGSAENWYVWHRSVSSNDINAANNLLRLNMTNEIFTGTKYLANPTSTTFQVGDKAGTNGSGQTYVAYLFAHDAGGFGDSGNDSVVKCGSYTGSSTGATVDLGWEPQWLLIKKASGGTFGDSNSDWLLLDVMRGMTHTNSASIYANTSSAEVVSGNRLAQPTPTGFSVPLEYYLTGETGATYIYIAIRRGPMKTPTDATKVFSALARTGTGATVTTSAGLAPDLAIINYLPGGGDGHGFHDRLRGQYRIDSNDSGAEGFGSAYPKFDQMTGVQLITSQYNSSGQSMIDWYFRRAPGFFDVVACSGTGAVRSHNLGVSPELIIGKHRNVAYDWLGATNLGGFVTNLSVNASNSFYQDTASSWATYVTSTTFDESRIKRRYNGGSSDSVTDTVIYYLFATCPGVSKCFNYTGTGTTLQINCGFTNGARLVLIKRTDSTGDWYIWDSARGIISGNDPYLLLNSTAAEVTNTDYIDPYSAGFEISSTAPAAINANGGSYIGLAIA